MDSPKIQFMRRFSIKPLYRQKAKTSCRTETGLRAHELDSDTDTADGGRYAEPLSPADLPPTFPSHRHRPIGRYLCLHIRFSLAVSRCYMKQLAVYGVTRGQRSVGSPSIPVPTVIREWFRLWHTMCRPEKRVCSYFFSISRAASRSASVSISPSTSA